MDDLLTLSKEFLNSIQVIDWSYTEKDRAISFDKFESWLKKGHHKPLEYLGGERGDKRKSVSSFYSHFQSALVFLFDYRSSAKRNQESGDHQFAAYTKGFDGQDYHYWIKEKLDLIANKLNFENYQLSIDMHPVLERDLAYRSGLGWFGKNSMLINKKHGSFFLIASLLLPKKLSLQEKIVLETDHCGTCTRCIDTCPTEAIASNRTIISEKCISTFTIEMFKEAKPPKGYPSERGEIFGCDICQDVCPWNRRPLLNATSDQEVPFEKTFSQVDLELMSNREFRRVFKGTSLERTGRVGLLKNIKAGFSSQKN